MKRKTVMPHLLRHLHPHKEAPQQVRGNMSHCGTLVYNHDRDRFLLSLFASPGAREALLAVYALNVELMQVQGKVSEELIAHMRYAWWQERIEGLYAGKSTPGHPVLEALQPVVPHVPKEMLLGLVEEWRGLPPLPPAVGGIAGEGWGEGKITDSPHPDFLSSPCAALGFAKKILPSPASGRGEGIEEKIIDTISLHLLRSLCPEAEPRFRKAHVTITRHRQRYGHRWNGWLSFKVLMVVELAELL